MPTLQDVADLAGVSTATVSKVLSNTPYFSEETRKKVMEAVVTLGYRPNIAARALSGGKTNIIGVVFPYIYDAIFQDPLTMQILEGIETVCTQQHYNLLLSTPRIQQDDLDEHYLRLIQSRYAEGIIAIDNIPSQSFSQAAKEYGIPTVAISYHTDDYIVRSDDEAGGKLAMQYLLDCGHRQIGIISVPLTTNLAISRRIDGMRAAANACGMNFDDFAYIEGDFSTKGGAKAAEDLLIAHPDMTAMISVNDRMALGAIGYCQQIGKLIPDDISVIGYDNINATAVSNPPLTTIDQNAVEIGQQAATLLFEQLNDDIEPTTQTIPARLIARASVASIN